MDNKNNKNTKKGKNNWIIWLIIAIIAILIIILSMRSCNRNKVADRNAIRQTENVVTEKVDKAVEKVDNTVNNMREKITLTLPDGEKITVFKNGCEDRMLSYLKSDEYAKATSADLKKNWIHFDNIDFRHDSATQLEAGSMDQLNNIAKILKNYPNAKIRIGGFADKTGTVAINEEISKERADYVKSVFVKNGVAASRVSTEGFGEEFATVPVDATDAQRAIDRHIALRFDK